MEVRQQVRDTELFNEAPTQSDGATRFTVKGCTSGPSIYAHRHDREAHIRQGGLQHFPNAERLGAYVASHAVLYREYGGDPHYVLDADQLPMVLRIIRRGTQGRGN